MKIPPSTLALIAIGLSLGAPLVKATPIGPVYPPPGGVSFSTSGASSAGDAGGTNFIFSGFNSSDYSDLYWGLASSTSAAAGFDGGLSNFTFDQVLGSTAIWKATSNWFDPAKNTNYSVTINMDITLNGGAFWVAAGSLGLDPNLGVLANLSFVPSGPFFNTFNISFVGQGPPGSGLGSNTALNSFEGPTNSTFSGGFYYDPPASSSVPDSGSTLLLLIPAILGMCGMKRFKALRRTG
jgi:hypothetical protein